MKSQKSSRHKRQISISHEPRQKEVEDLLVSLKQERFSEALAIAQSMTTRFPQFGFGWIVLGATLKQMGRIADSLPAMRRAVELSPGIVEVHYNLGTVLHDLGQLEESLISYQRALQIDPTYSPAHFNLGVALGDLGRPNEALASYRRVLEIMPSDVEARYNLATTLQKLGSLNEAAASFRQVLDIKPDYVDALNNLGMVLRDLGQFAEAAACYRQAVLIKPNYAKAYLNLGNVLIDSDQLKEAEACIQRALEIKPDFHNAAWNLSLLLLSQGRYAEAWPIFESRYKIKDRCNIPPLPYPRWRGENLVGKSLLLVPDQGFGDYIQFVRYAALLRESGLTHLAVLCAQPLKALLETMSGVDEVITDLSSAGVHDYWSSAMSLPLHFGTTLDNIPSAIPYLHASPDRVAQWRDSLSEGGLKVGLVWKGSPENVDDATRSLPGLFTLAPLWTVPGVIFISLQKGQGEEEANLSPYDQPIVPLGSSIKDFGDSAAIVSQLDLVICVDTAIAHLAGALGKPCWVLLPALRTDWRWLQQRTDSPWYPGVVRLFRQTREESWDEVALRVATALREAV